MRYIRHSTPISPLARVCALLLSLIFVIVAPARAQEDDVLTGRVLDEGGQPVLGARVEAMSIETEITRSALTDRSGRYLINFPDGGGRYILRITFIGKADVVRTLVREGGEDLLIANVTMSTQAIAVDAVTAVARRPQPSSGRTGEQSTELSQDLLNRLPLPDLDPNTLAQLAAGVVTTELDSLTGRSGISVAGMSELLNQIVLDGMILGESTLQIPQEGVRRTSVTTSTFDPSRGGFAGGQVSLMTARGNNRVAGALMYSLDNDAFQLGSAATVNAYSRHNISGAIGGPVIRNEAFYNISFGVQRNVNHRVALSANDEVSALRAGVALDSVARFVNALSAYGVPVNTNGEYDHRRDNVMLQLRTDWNLVRRENQQHTLSLRLNGSRSAEDSTRISALDLTQHGGDTEGDNWAAALSMSSRYGTNWTNSLAFSFNESWNESLPFLSLPEGRVRVTSQFEDATRATQTLVFGGNRSMPSDAYRRGLQLSNDLSFLLPIGSHVHRLKVGGMLQRTRNVSRSADNVFGSFIYNSIRDLENNKPVRYERTLAELTSRYGSTLAGLYVGDTWRVSQKLELTGGLRWDRMAVHQAPAYNPAVESAFGRRTDIEPVAIAWSPRLGFNYRIAASEGMRSARTLSGGIGLFAGQTPTHIFVNASRQTGLADAEQRLICIGAATPIPDWDLYLADPASIPDECADGSAGRPSQALRTPTVSLINPDQRMPASLRAELGYRTRLPLNLNANFRYSFARGVSLWGYYDINLDHAHYVTLGSEARPFFGDASSIVRATGQTTLATSRIHSRFGNVFDIRADRASTAHQLIAQVTGQLPRNYRVSTNYTLSFARDNGGSFGTPTAANPNQPEWAASGNDRRHTLNLTIVKAFLPEVEVAAIGRLSSGAPFTPMVAGDINGDGLSNDRAFIFAPSYSDVAVATGMRNLLNSVPARIAECLRDQFGQIADRNSCRSAWSHGLDIRGSVRPNLPRIERRLTISIDANNILRGKTARVDNRLLEVRGFNSTTNSFVYEVNEAFGQSRRGAFAIRNPFALRLTARLAVGGPAFQNNRGFGSPMAARDLAGAAGRDRGGRGGFGDGFTGMFRREESGNFVGLVDRMLANPVPVLLELKDNLALSADQVARVQEISAALQEKLMKRREELGRKLESVSAPQQGQLLLELQPIIEMTREEVTNALAKVQKVLTPEQWAKVPNQVRNPFPRGVRQMRRDQ